MKVQLLTEESHIFLEGVKHNQDILNQNLSSLKEKIDDMQYVSYMMHHLYGKLQMLKRK
jgi:hypothetical protein